MHATAFTLALSKILGADTTRPMHEGKWKDSDFKKNKKKLCYMLEKCCVSSKVTFFQW